MKITANKWVFRGIDSERVSKKGNPYSVVFFVRRKDNAIKKMIMFDNDLQAFKKRMRAGGREYYLVTKQNDTGGELFVGALSEDEEEEETVQSQTVESISLPITKSKGKGPAKLASSSASSTTSTPNEAVKKNPRKRPATQAATTSLQSATKQSAAAVGRQQSAVSSNAAHSSKWFDLNSLNEFDETMNEFEL